MVGSAVDTMVWSSAARHAEHDGGEHEVDVAPAQAWRDHRLGCCLYGHDAAPWRPDPPGRSPAQARQGAVCRPQVTDACVVVDSRATIGRMSDEPQDIEFVRPRAEHDATVDLSEADPAWAEEFADLAAVIHPGAWLARAPTAPANVAVHEIARVGGWVTGGRADAGVPRPSP